MLFALLLHATADTTPAVSPADDEKTPVAGVEVIGDPLASPLARRSASASRLDKSLFELPVSADAITQDTLRRRAETTLHEALEQAPGVVAAYSFGVTNIASRGFSGVFNSPTLYDGIRYPGWQLSSRSTLNYAQVEVLRGPAALAAGVGSVAGAINLVPYRATGEEQRHTYLGWGRYANQVLNLGAGGEVGRSALDYRIDLTYQGSNQRGSYGYARNTSYSYEHLSAELAVPVGADWRLSLAVEGFDDDGEGFFGSPLVSGRLDESLRDINYNVVDDTIRMRANWARLRAEWRPGEATSGRLMVYANDEERRYRNAEAYTWQVSSNTVRRNDYLDIRHDQSLIGGLAELKWSHTLFDRESQTVIGIQFDQNEHDRFNDSPFRFTDVVPLVPVERGIYRSLDVFGPRTATDIDQLGLYLENDWRLGARYALLTGVRFDRNEVDSVNASSGQRFTRDYDTPAFRLGLSYRPASDVMLYASASTSSQPPAQITTLSLANAAFDLTDSEQLEIGLKQRWSHGEWTLAAYDLRQTNILSRDPADPNRLIQIGEQAAIGIEVSGLYRPSERLSLHFNAAVLDARFERFDERVGGVLVSRSGQLPPAVPEQSGAAWIEFSANERLDFALGLRGVGRSAANNANTVFLPGYGTVDASASYDSERYGRFQIKLRNLADRYYATRPYNGGAQFMTGEPFWFELNWQLRF